LKKDNGVNGMVSTTEHLDPNRRDRYGYYGGKTYHRGHYEEMAKNYADEE